MNTHIESCQCLNYPIRLDRLKQLDLSFAGVIIAVFWVAVNYLQSNKSY